MAHGFVYVLKNESMPGIYKIGFTLKHPKERMAELSRATSCPTPFELLAFIGCAEPQETEADIHDALSACRVNEAREFFKADLSLIQDLLRQHGDPYDDAFCDSPLDLEAHQCAREREQEWLRRHFFEQSADPIHWRRGFE